MFFRTLVFAVFVLSLLTGTAHAQEYVDATWPHLVETLVRFGAMDLADQDLLDEYAAITDCDMYQEYFANDFRWNSVRRIIRKSVQMNVGNFPVAYHYDMRMQLDRYDFATKQFRFTLRSSLDGVNVIFMYRNGGPACGVWTQYIPRSFRVVLTTILNKQGIPLSESDAHNLITLMDLDQNEARIIYARFNMRIVNIEPLVKHDTRRGNRGELTFTQTPISGREVRLDARLDSVDFYEDKERKKLIAEIRP